MAVISDQLADDIITVCSAYRKGSKMTVKTMFGEKKKQLLNQINDLDYIIEELKKAKAS